MKKYLKNWRFYVAVVLLAVTFLGLAAIPNDDLPDDEWIDAILYTKGTALLALYTLVMLLKRWDKKGKLPEFGGDE